MIHPGSARKTGSVDGISALLRSNGCRVNIGKREKERKRHRREREREREGSKERRRNKRES